MFIGNRRNKEHRVLDVIALDKGKRHYWDGVHGDYGFMQSEDRRQIRRMRQSSLKFNHKRVHTQAQLNPEFDTHQEGYQLYHDLQINSTKAEADTKRKLQITNNLQIHLPPIQKNKSMLVQAKLDDNYQTEKLIAGNRNTIREQYKNERPRVRTEASDYYQYSRKRLIRYTPTYICSLGNPLPTYKLYPNGTSRRHE